ncbi:hypothetical protein BDZ91DRAFT_443977 [Kalaharituber pfeilii]|nr:hypothetical protein BDZ91DRAFT_443977 [Kalaharituber pfeilii]
MPGTPILFMRSCLRLYPVQWTCPLVLSTYSVSPTLAWDSTQSSICNYSQGAPHLSRRTLKQSDISGPSSMEEAVNELAQTLSDMHETMILSFLWLLNACVAR